MKVTKEQLIKAIHANAGIVDGIRQSIKELYNEDISRAAIYDRKYNDPDIEAAFIEAREKTLDIAENRLLYAVKDGNLKAVMFYLKTIGKNRGYSERQEVTGADGQAIQVRDPLAGFSKEELMDIAGLTDETADKSKD